MLTKAIGQQLTISTALWLAMSSLPGLPALAQESGVPASDQLDASRYGRAATGADKGQDSRRTGVQTQLSDAMMSAPGLQCATNGTVGPQGADATVIMGVNTAGTIRVNNLANLEALLNIIANGMEILGIAW